MGVRDTAERIGIPPSTYAGIERGRPMSGETLGAIWHWMLED
jgi:hypothetical protein